jgi:hypothetical protein
LRAASGWGRNGGWHEDATTRLAAGAGAVERRTVRMIIGYPRRDNAASC